MMPEVSVAVMMPDPREEKRAIVGELLAAIEAKDAEAVTDALEAFVESCAEAYE